MDASEITKIKSAENLIDELEDALSDLWADEDGRGGGATGGMEWINEGTAIKKSLERWSISDDMDQLEALCNDAREWLNRYR